MPPNAATRSSASAFSRNNNRRMVARTVMSGGSSRVRDDHTIPVPEADATWRDVWRFALTYNAYDRHGGLDGAARIGNEWAKQWRRNKLLPNDLATARAALFYEQRRYRHFDSDPGDEAAAYVRELVEAIRRHSGGAVVGPPDDLP